MVKRSLGWLFPQFVFLIVFASTASAQDIAPAPQATLAPDQATNPLPAGDPSPVEQSAPVSVFPIFSVSRIVNGMPAPAGSAPWMAQLFTSYVYDCGELQKLDKQGPSLHRWVGQTALTSARTCLQPGADPNRALAHSESWQLTHKCGGSYLGNGWIVTAAHCFLWKGDLPNPVEQQMMLKEWRIRLGAMDISNQGQVLSIDRIVVHSGFRASKRTTMANDIALVQIRDRASIKLRSIRPIRLATRDNDFAVPGTTVFVTGWGSQTPHTAGQPVTGVEKGSAELKRSELKVTEDCNETSPDPAVRDYFKDHPQAPTAICATGVPRNGQGTGDCFGDSGGPITLASKSGTPTLEPVPTPKSYLLVGVVSGGPACGGKGVPGVYTRISDMKPWIDRVMASSAPGFSEK